MIIQCNHPFRSGIARAAIRDPYPDHPQRFGDVRRWRYWTSAVQLWPDGQYGLLHRHVEAIILL